MYIMYDCMCIFIQIQLRVHRYDNTACATSAYQRSYSETLWENFLSSQTCMLVSSSPKRGRGGAAHLRCFGLERGFAERCLCIRPHPQSRQRFDTWWGLELKFKWKPYFLPRLGYSDVLILQQNGVICWSCLDQVLSAHLLSSNVPFCRSWRVEMSLSNLRVEQDALGSKGQWALNGFGSKLSFTPRSESRLMCLMWDGRITIRWKKMWSVKHLTGGLCPWLSQTCGIPEGSFNSRCFEGNLCL